MTVIRSAAVAGQFYPDRAQDLVATVSAMLDAVPMPPVEVPPPKAIIAPHAGYVYSGPVAASVYKRLLPLRGRVRRVVLLGPSHRVAFRGMALSSADVWQMPDGPVMLDRAGAELAATVPGVIVEDRAHRQEHCLEVHLPFLRAVLGNDFALLPVVIGQAEPAQVEALLAALWGGPETLIVISSDLSHYLSYTVARQRDSLTAQAIERLDESDLGFEDACGRLPVAGLLRLARAKGLSVERVDLRSSGDTAGPRDQVVGYGAWVFTEPAGASGHWLDQCAPQVLRLAAASIQHGLRHGRPLVPDVAALPAPLQEDGAAFVTLMANGQLRGCIGSVEASQPVGLDIADNAFRAAFEDPRFLPVERAELAGLSIHVSVLSPPEPFVVADEADLLARLRPGKDGIILSDRGRRALFLPSVWSQLPDPAQFIAHLKAKAGWPQRYWSPTMQVQRFETHEVMSEDLADPTALWGDG